MDFLKERGNERDGVLSIWQGYHGEVELVTYPSFDKRQIKKVAIGAEHSIFLTADKEVFSCGSNRLGQLGIGSAEPESVVDPVRVTVFDDKEVVDIACGTNHCAVVTKEGDVYCWGESKGGQCGKVVDRVISPELVPVQDVSPEVCEHGVPATSSDVQVCQVACGRLHTMALSQGNELYGWGSGPALGLSSGVMKPTVIQKLRGKKVISVSCGDFHNIVLLENVTPRQKPKMSPAKDTKSNKFYPSTCTECNSEIYSYTDSDDTCIINNEHSCDHKQPTTSSDTEQGNVNSQSDESLHSLGAYDVSDISTVLDDSKDVSDLSIKDVDSSNNEGSDEKDDVKDKKYDIKVENNDEKENKSSEEAKESSADHESASVADDLKNSEKCDANETASNENASETSADREIVTVIGDKENSEGSANNKDPPNDSAILTDNSQKVAGVVESESSSNNAEKQTKLAKDKLESRDKTLYDPGNQKENVQEQDKDIQNKEHDKDYEQTLHVEVSDSKSEKKLDKLSVSPSSSIKSYGFIDENEARTFLAKQYEDKELPEPGESETRSPSSFGSFWSALPKTSSDVLMQMSAVHQHVSSMTTKALSSVAERMPSFATGQTSLDESSIEQDTAITGSDASSAEEKGDNSGSASTTENSGTTGEQDNTDESSFIESIKENTPYVNYSSEDLRDGETNITSNRMSLKTIWAKQDQLEKRTSFVSQSSESIQELQYPLKEVTIDTEVWTWGKNSRGQLGIGDMIDRNNPCPVKMMNGRRVVKAAAGSNHTLLLTADSQVYSCGLNASGQLGHNEESSKLSRIKLMSGCFIWDIAAGECFSIFLMDRSGFQPEVHYVGKHPCKDLYVPINKTSRLTALNFLKQTSWIRYITAGDDLCACLSCWSFSGHTATVYELSSLERRFYHRINRIDRHYIAGIRKSAFFTSFDVYPYKPSLQTLLTYFNQITTMIGRSNIEIAQLIREGEDLLRASFFVNYQKYLQSFRRFVVAFGDMLAITGFEYCVKTGSGTFDELSKFYSLLFDEKKIERKKHAVMFRKMMMAPIHHMKEYCRLTEKLSGNYPQDSEEFNVLSSISLKWNSIQHLAGNELAVAEVSGAFWELSINKHLVDALRTPSRRVIRESKAHPLTMQGGGRFSSHLFILCNDLFIHSQYSTYQVFQLETLWVEAASGDNTKQQQTLIITAPEDKLTLVAPSIQAKTEWLMSLNSTINKKISGQKCMTSQRGSMEGLSPPTVRQATHTFTKHSVFRDAQYTGSWLSGQPHGHGEMKWNDGRKYIGHFKQGTQHGRGKLTIMQDGGTERVQEGYWREGRLHGLGKVKYSSGDVYEGHFREGQRHGHGMYKQGSHTATSASIYIGEWNYGKKHGYGVMDDVLKGEKYMGMWSDDLRHGSGIIVTLDGMYFEGNFNYDKMSGFGVMLTDDNSCYEGEFSGITQLQGKGTLILPTGDKIEGIFNGSWNEGLKINGTFHKMLSYKESRSTHSMGLGSSHYGKLCVPSDKRWCDLFHHCMTILGVTNKDKVNTKKAWEGVAVMISRGRESLRDTQKSSTRRQSKIGSLEGLEKIPPHSTGFLTADIYKQIQDYLQKAFDTPFHPLGKLMEGLVDVFRAAYIGVGAHPRLLSHAVKEVTSYIIRLYKTVRVLFPDLPANGGPLLVFPENQVSDASVAVDRQISTDEGSIVMSDGSLLYPLLLPKIYPPLFDLYALYNDKEDEKYWERVQKLNKQGDMALMAYLGIDQKFWLIEESLFHERRTKLSSLRDHCYLSSIDTLQQISTAFSPKEKLEVIQLTFLEITKTVQTALSEVHMWCMDELFPVFQYVVVRAKIRHLGAEVRLIEDLMERHLENGELGIMFTTLHACYYQIQNEKIANH